MRRIETGHCFTFRRQHFRGINSLKVKQCHYLGGRSAYNVKMSSTTILNTCELAGGGVGQKSPKNSLHGLRMPVPVEDFKKILHCYLVIFVLYSF